MPRVLHWIDTTDNEPKGIPTIITAARLALQGSQESSFSMVTVHLHSYCYLSFVHNVDTYRHFISDRTCTLRPVTVVIPQHEPSTSPASVF